MQRFEFRLERLLKWRKHQERMAELRQQQARVLLDAAVAEVERLTAQIEETAASLDARVQAGGWTSACLACYQHTAQLAQGLAQAQKKVVLAERQLQQANAVRAGFAMQVESLEVLRRQQWLEHRRRQQRHEQERLDAAGLSQWLREQANDR